MNWGPLRPNKRPQRQRNRYTNQQRQTHRTNDLVQKTEELTLNKDVEIEEKCEETKSEYIRHSRRKDSKPYSSLQSHEDLQQKLDELTALKSIYDENVLTVDENELKGRFLAEPVLNANKLTVVYKLIERNDPKYSKDRTRQRPNDKARDDPNSNLSKQTEEFIVQHLPPIELYFELSHKYPSKLHPLFLISCKWLTRFQLGIF